MAFNTGFLLPAITAIYSLFVNNNDIRLHVFYADLSDNGIRTIKKLEGCGVNNTVEFILIRSELLDRVKVATGRWRQECFFRYFATDLLPDADRALWLDSDVLVRKSIADLYNTDLEGKSFAGVYDTTSKPLERIGIKYYINSGVLLFDLKKLRGTQMMDKYWDLVASPDYKPDLPDQDALNIVFEGDIKLLDVKYNSFPLTDNKHADHLIGNSAIVHFISKYKPWNKEDVEYFVGCFEKYRTAEQFVTEYWDVCDKAVAFIEN